MEPPGELPSLPDLNAAAGEALVEISTSETADDWQERWKRFHRPVLVEAPAERAGAVHDVPALFVRPPWEPPSAGRDAGVREIVIDPGQAFGTGAHASTRLCLELLLELAALERAAGPLVDVGHRVRCARDSGGATRVRAGAGARSRARERRGRASTTRPSTA